MTETSFYSLHFVSYVLVWKDGGGFMTHYLTAFPPNCSMSNAVFMIQSYNESNPVNTLLHTIQASSTRFTAVHCGVY